jgi:hypothetical protein
VWAAMTRDCAASTRLARAVGTPKQATRKPIKRAHLNPERWASSSRPPEGATPGGAFPPPAARRGATAVLRVCYCSTLVWVG